MTPIGRLLNIVQFDLAEKLNLARLRWYHLNHQDQYLQLTPEHQDIIVIDLKKHLKSFIQDKDQAEEMITQYTCYYNALKKWESNHKKTEILHQLEISNLLEQLKNN